MKKKAKATASASLHPRFRILCGKDIALGPGKVELLEAIQKTGSIGEAAQLLDMSYMRAWTLIKTMEHCFKEPLVKAERGGKAGGGARLTEDGEKILKLYGALNEASRKAVEPFWKQLQPMLR